MKNGKGEKDFATGYEEKFGNCSQENRKPAFFGSAVAIAAAFSFVSAACESRTTEIRIAIESGD